MLKPNYINHSCFADLRCFCIFFFKRTARAPPMEMRWVNPGTENLQTQLPTSDEPQICLYHQIYWPALSILNAAIDLSLPGVVLWSFDQPTGYHTVSCAIIDWSRLDPKLLLNAQDPAKFTFWRCAELDVANRKHIRLGRSCVKIIITVFFAL